ncbi:hypothetical protein [Rhodococcus jostii]|uniref:hypothetical protein n=1 Tax=Rhodococcus jostii TaxID=132919 RepID=UPI00364FED6A
MLVPGLRLPVLLLTCLTTVGVSRDGEGEVGADLLAVFVDERAERVGQGVGAVRTPVEGVVEQGVDERGAGVTVGAHHRFCGDADAGPQSGGHGRHPVTEDPGEHRQSQERARGLQQVEPAVGFGGSGGVGAVHCTAPSGTTIATAKGKTSSRTFS